MTTDRTDGAGSVPGRYWRALGVYLFVTVLGVVAIPVVGDRLPSVLTGSLTVIVLFLLVVASVGALYALVRDSVALGRANARWEPVWWVYLGASLAVPAAVAYGTKAFAGVNAGIVAGVPTLVATVFAACAGYLYRRHDRLGVP
ncbi:hypothetical protein [Halobaculum litoreum]|uniref:Integral membrane protein n=1 Tax=Halobaculum litoreum TaxID=3031998 RepID=A0ABD5XLT5_9EURY|nr:hypothetical protein [Halobaculum sp. DT92]